MDLHNGQVPKDIEKLVKLSGVGRKTANVILWNAFGINQGVAVDTHVKRISFLLGLTLSQDPKVIEKDIMSITPKKHWGDLTNLVISHGRAICIANRPKCNGCCIEKLCKSSLLKRQN